MFIEKCISTMLSMVIFVDSSFIGLPIRYIESESVQEPVIGITQEIIIDEPIIETVEPVEQENTVEETVVVESSPEPVVSTPQPTVSNELPISDSEIDLVALVTMAEAEGESEQGKRAVIDVILNQYESPRFANTIEGVIYAKNAFECMWNGRVNRCYVREDIRQLVIEELSNRTYPNIYYFRASRYHSFGTPVINIGNHYFSTF